MSEEQRSTAGTEAERQEQGMGHRQPIQGSEQSRGNEAPEPASDSGAVAHARRTIAGAEGPIEIEEESGTAGAETGAKV